MFRKYGSVLACMLGLLLLNAGCVSEQVRPAHEPELAVSQSGDILTISLTTEVGYLYTILYKDPRSEGLKPLPGCEKIRGTGKLVEIRKKFNSRNPVPMMFVDFVRIK